MQLGLNCIIAGIVSVILASCYHRPISSLFSLTAEFESGFVFYGLSGGGLLAGLGVVITVFGFIRSPCPSRNNRLIPSLITLIILILFFFMSLFSFFNSTDPQHISPNETVSV